MAKLGELYKITSGGTPSRTHSEYYEDGTIPWVKTGDLKDKYLFETDEKISQLGLENSSARIYLKNTVLLAMYGATIGATSILKIDAATNQACAAFSPREDTLPEYLYAFLESQKDKFIKDAVGGAQPNLSAGYLKTIEFKLPSLEQQTRITRNLSKIDELLLLRKQQIAKLDELVKAQFANTFENDANFHTDYMENLSEFVTVGIANSATHAYAEHGVVMLRNQNIKENHLDDTELVYIEPKFADKYKSKKLEANDILVTRTGYPGIACVVPQKYAGSQTFTTLIIRLKKGTNASSCYICHYINSSHGKKYVSGTKVGVAQQNFGAKVLAKMPVIVPPIELQNQFATFVARIDQQKQTVQQSLEKLELMKKALMQEYFG